MAERESTAVVFEHPLNERVRTLLRLEFLFEQGRFGMRGDSQWHSRLAVTTLVDLVALLSRGDLRSEIQKELERLVTTLEGLESRPGVDSRRLQPLLEQCRDIMSRLRAAAPGTPPAIRDNELLGSVEQRSGILGGTCGFDLPGYHLWLHRPAQWRRKDLERWFGGFEVLRDASATILDLLRGSANPSEENAGDGVYQTTLDRGKAYQLLRVFLEPDSACYPEISGNRHFFTIRFMTQSSPKERPQQTEADVSFILERCAI